MAVLGATGIYTLDHFRASLAQCLARMARKGIIIVGFVDLVWLAYILMKIKDKYKRTKGIKDKERPHRQRQVKKEKRQSKRNKEVCNCWKHRRRS
jgi:hypothetical protein